MGGGDERCAAVRRLTHRGAHKAEHHNSLTPTFGFEAIIRALHSCDKVDLYGFYIPPKVLETDELEALRKAEKRLHLEEQPEGTDATGAEGGAFRYHYWQEAFEDKSAPTPSKPWTYKSHNYAIESARIRHMACAGLLRLHV